MGLRNQVGEVKEMDSGVVIEEGGWRAGMDCTKKSS